MKKVYVECGRDTLLDDHLKTFVENMFAKRDGGRDDGRIFFVTGESGAGKSVAVKRMLTRHPALQPIQTSYGVIRLVVSVSLRGPTTLRLVGDQIMSVARGFTSPKKLSQSDVWDEMPLELRHRKVLLVHIDEPQHLLKEFDSGINRENLANALKGVMNYVEWPVSFVLSGLPITDRIAKLDEQFERRGTFFRLPDLSMPDERELVVRIIRKMSEAGGVNAQDILATDVPDRLAHAAHFRYGRITQGVLAALQIAFQFSLSTLTRDAFAAAYRRHSHAMGHDSMNPFLAEDWRNLPPGSFLFEEGSQ